MNPLLLIRVAPYAIGVLIIASAALFVFKAGQDSRQAKWDADVARQVSAQLAKNQADAVKLKKLEEAKNENLVEIDRLRSNNHALWLRLPKTPCTGNTPSGDTPAGAGELPTAPEIAFKRFTDGLADEAYRADRIVEDCRMLNAL